MPIEDLCVSTQVLARTTADVAPLLDTEGRPAIVPRMPVTPEELAEKAMDLSNESRAQLADLLVESLDASELGKVDRAWVAEAKRRRDEVRAGKVKTIPADEALKQVRDALKR